jgi:hypothetical protein
VLLFKIYTLYAFLNNSYQFNNHTDNYLIINFYIAQNKIVIN